MAEIYIVETLSHYISDYPDDGSGVEMPDDVPEGRFPLLKEMHTVFLALNLKVRPTDDNDKFVSYDIEDVAGDRTELVMTKPLDAPIEFGFTGGELRLIVEIMERLARVCGPYILIPASGDPPLIVAAGDDPDELVARYCELFNNDDDGLDDEEEEDDD